MDNILGEFLINDFMMFGKFSYRCLELGWKYQLETEKELTQWPNASDPLKQVDSKTKAALTRTYNKLNIKRSYAVQGKEKPKKKGKASVEGDENENSENEQRLELFWNPKK